VKCRRCEEKAAINMRHHKLALCKTHFLDWIPEQTERIIHKYRMFDQGHRILVAVSGGKDSLSLWDILWRLGYHADGLYIGLGIDGGFGYSAQSQNRAENFASQNGLNLHVFNVQQEFGETIPDMTARTHRGKTKPCSVCGLTKRHIMNRVAREGGYDVLVTGHNLDDEAAVLLGNTLNWHPGYLLRQGPVLETRDGMARKTKPLCRFYEREMAAYALLRGIEYVYEECPFAENANSIYYKEMLNKLEADKPGAKLNFYLTFLQAKENGLFSQQADPDLQQLHACPTCGQPTSAPEQCIFCKMVNPTQSSQL
jgi:tRNA-5-methyluridine54 2-sulfurtransferase